MSLTSRIGTAILFAALAFAPAYALADHIGPSPAVPPFYQSVLKMKPAGKLGHVLKQATAGFQQAVAHAALPFAHVLPVTAAVNAAGRLEIGGCDDQIHQPES